MADKIKLGYWGIRGMGQTPRLLLAYSGLDWEEVRYADREQWFAKDKNGLGLTFPNLPYLIDGDFKLTESRALQIYIIKKSGKTELLGKDIKDEARVECLLGVITDLRHSLAPLAFDKDWKTKVGDLIAKGEPKLAEMAKLYGEKDFALGYLTLADFVIAEFSYYVEHVTP